jgi:hypothetical protein
MAGYTVASEPPVQQDQRRSRWADLFEECRKYPNEWRRVVDPMKKSTAAQIASDIRNAHTRDVKKSRLRGFEAGDMWDAKWGQDPSDKDPDAFYIWLRFLGKKKR